MQTMHWLTLTGLLTVLLACTAVGAALAGRRWRRPGPAQPPGAADEEPMSASEADAIQCSASYAAVRFVQGERSASTNPYSAGSHRHSLWDTTFQRVSTHFG